MYVSNIRLIGLHTVDFPIAVAKPSDTYLLKAADGLGPPGFDVSIVGNTYQGRQPRNRELIFRIGLNPNFKLLQTADQLRDKLYTMVMPANDDGSIEIQLTNKEVVLATVNGYVSNIDPAMFTKTPEVQMTIECTHPYLFAPDEISVVPPNAPSFSITNAGTAPAGIEFAVQFLQDTSSWVLSYGGKKMQFDSNFKTGDILTVNTTPGQLSIVRTRNGVDKIFIQALSKDSTWVALHGGVNPFSFDNTVVSWQYVRYTPLYLGV